MSRPRRYARTNGLDIRPSGCIVNLSERLVARVGLRYGRNRTSGSSVAEERPLCSKIGSIGSPAFWRNERPGDGWRRAPRPRPAGGQASRPMTRRPATQTATRTTRQGRRWDCVMPNAASPHRKPRHVRKRPPVRVRRPATPIAMRRYHPDRRWGCAMHNAGWPRPGSLDRLTG